MGKAARKRVLENNQCSAKSTYVRISPYKLGLVAGLIRNLRANEALVQLDFSKKRIAKQVKDLLLSAIANAENNHGLDIDNLIVSEVRVGKKFLMKRFRARARGRGARIIKPVSRMEIVLTEVTE